PAIQSDFKIKLSQLEWTVNAYTLTYAVLLLTGGKLADIRGRRLIFLIGLALFVGSSFACGFAPSADFLIGARAVQGVGAAFMVLESVQKAPMLELGMFRNPTFSGANTVGLLVFLAMVGLLFYVSIYLQIVLRYSPIQAGATFLPLTLMLVVASPIGGKITD